MSNADRPVAVVDIDGVLADVRHRLHFVQSRPRDYVGFHSAADVDPLLAEGGELVGRLADVCRIVYLSGRPEWLRPKTEAWLAHHDLPDGELYLRPHRDYRPAAAFKVEVLTALRARGVVSVVVDDDLSVIAAVTAAGFDVLPATWMTASADLHEAQEVDGRT